MLHVLLLWLHRIPVLTKYSTAAAHYKHVLYHTSLARLSTQSITILKIIFMARKSDQWNDKENHKLFWIDMLEVSRTILTFNKLKLFCHLK